MTKTILRASNVLLCLVLAVGLSRCTDSEQQAQIDKQKRYEQQEARDKADRDKRLAEEAAAAAQAAPPPAASPEPQQTPEASAESTKVVRKHFTSSTERQTVDCDSSPEVTPCGISFSDCDDHHASYYCQLGVRAWQTTE